MMRPTHTAFALAGALGVLNVTHPDLDDGAVLVAVTLATAMLPDQLEGGILPHRGATHRWWMGVLLVTLVAFGLSRLVVLSSSSPLVTDVRAAVAAYAPWFLGGLTIGYGMHLFADGLTRTGLPKRKRWGEAKARRLRLLPRWLRPYTGGVSEVPFRIAAIIACVALAWPLVPAATRDAATRGLTEHHSPSRAESSR